MNKIIIVRHGESEGNANNIIQGRNNDYGLTLTGKQMTYTNVHTYMDSFKGVQHIISSPSKRTMETAEIISNELGIQVIKDCNIEEMDAGILSGIKKEDAGNLYPTYYDIWKNRQDLDEIPYAETGENLQARAIGFIMQYYNKPEYCDVIVSHAGFIRCLINTIENRERTFQFDIENGSIFSINNIFEKMNIQKRERAMNSQVLIVNTINGTYVAKLKKGSIREQDYAEQLLLNNMDGNNIPKILFLQNYENGQYCKIIKYVKGRHIYGKLDDNQYEALIRSERKLRKDLDLYGSKSKLFKVNNLREKVERIFKNAKNPYIKENAQNLLNSEYWSEIENIEDYVLSHSDINRDNVLFEEMDDDKIRANIIDFESLELSPKDFQFASMLASGLLLEGENIEKLKETIKKNNMDIEKILFFMQIRILEGLYFFRESSNEYVSNNESVSKDLLRKYFYSNEIVQKEINKLKKTKGEKDDEKIVYR